MGDLTDKALKNLKPRAKLYKVTDRDGMHAAVTPTGVTSFRYQYRVNGRQEVLTIGRYSAEAARKLTRAPDALEYGMDVSLAEARTLLARARRQVERGESPSKAKVESRPHMRFTPVKSRDEQALAQAYKTRGLLVAQRTALINALRAHLTEFGVVAAIGPAGAGRLIALVRAKEEPLPEQAYETLAELADMIEATQARIAAFDAKLQRQARADEASRRLMKIPGVGLVTAGTIRALVGDVTRFKTGRDFAAWLGLTPRQNSSGEKVRIGAISKAGNRELRSLLVMGQMAVFRHAVAQPDKASPWLAAMIKRRPRLVVVVAMAAKAARVIWAMLSRGEAYRPRSAAVTPA